MTSLPSKSIGSLLWGFWVVFNDDKHTIHVKVSQITGFRQIFLDGKKVLEERHWRSNSSHDFVNEGIRYRIDIRALKNINAHIECRLNKNDKIVESITFRQPNMIRNFFLFTLFWNSILAAVTGYYLVSDVYYYSLAAFVTSIGLVLVTSKKCVGEVIRSEVE